jgi:hypothetical protein
MFNYGRIILVLAVMGIGVLLYFYISDYRQEARRGEYLKYAGVMAETSVASEIYRSYPDSFIVARDSILKKYALTADDLEEFKARYKNDEPRWAEFWVYLDSLTDSLIHYYDSVYGGDVDTSKVAEDTVIDTRKPIGILRNRLQAAGYEVYLDSALSNDADTNMPGDSQ